MWGSCWLEGREVRVQGAAGCLPHRSVVGGTGEERAWVQCQAASAPSWRSGAFDLASSCSLHLRPAYLKQRHVGICAHRCHMCLIALGAARLGHLDLRMHRRSKGRATSVGGGCRGLPHLQVLLALAMPCPSLQMRPGGMELQDPAQRHTTAYHSIHRASCLGGCNLSTSHLACVLYSPRSGHHQPALIARSHAEAARAGPGLALPLPGPHKRWERVLRVDLGFGRGKPGFLSIQASDSRAMVSRVAKKKGRTCTTCRCSCALGGCVRCGVVRARGCESPHVVPTLTGLG